MYLNGVCDDLYCKIKNRTYFFSLCSTSINMVLAIGIVTMVYYTSARHSIYTDQIIVGYGSSVHKYCDLTMDT